VFVFQRFIAGIPSFNGTIRTICFDYENDDYWIDYPTSLPPSMATSVEIKKASAFGHEVVYTFELKNTHSEQKFSVTFSIYALDAEVNAWDHQALLAEDIQLNYLTFKFDCNTSE